VARIAGAFKARACVFGAPRQRDKGALSDKQASEIAVDFFRSVAPVFEQEGTALAFEANAKHYGCNFVTTTREAIALVRAIDREGVRLQIDTGTILLEEEDFDVLLDAAEYAVHAHASEPDLQVIKMGGADHQGLAASLSRSAYHGFLSIEMRCSEDWEASLRGAAKLVREQYA
jgi:sugar phosphate isomerase/epimerase